MPSWPGSSPFRLLLVAAVAAAFANGLTGSFQFDDWNVIVGDARVQSLEAWWASMPGIRPLLKLSYALNLQSGAGVVCFHALNLAVHAAAALLVHALLTRLAERLDVPTAAVGLAAVVFALHPVQTEAVTYISGRSASLAGLLCLGALVLWVDGRRVASAVAFAAALAVKETAAVLPVALVLWRLTAERSAWRAALRGSGLHWLVLACAALLALASPTYRHLLAVSLEARDIGVNLLTQAGAVVYLAGQLVRLDRLNADPMLPVVTDVWAALPAVVAVGGVAILGLALLRRRPGVAFGILWFLLWLAPTNSLLPRLDVANDRQLYLALVGPAWLLGMALARRATPAAVVAGALLLGVATHQRNRVYATEEAFWADVIAKTPHNARAYNNLGWAHLEACRSAEAQAAFAQATALDPQDFRAVLNARLVAERCPLTPPPASSPPRTG